MVEEENKMTLPPVVPLGIAPHTIKLGELIEFAIQQVYHELTVLTELLPKKQYEERKVSIVHFAHNVRMLFVKLLALVKWVKTSKKFDQCAQISYFLENQAQYLVDSADRLFQVREEMTFARLPMFQIGESVDGLTNGTYSKLPLCIKEAFIPKAKIKPRELSMVLEKIEQILKFRLSQETTALSSRIKEIKLKNGYVAFTVPGEFEVHLTLLNEKIDTPWILLNIKMLVEDYEIGYGTQLVHPLQLNDVHTQLQARLNVWAAEPNFTSLTKLYYFLHRFAQSIQLDILFCQASQISCGGEYTGKLIIEKYDIKERNLTIGYWLKQKLVRAGSNQIRTFAEYRMSIVVDERDDDLKIVHNPIHTTIGKIDTRPGHLSISRILSETFVGRAKERLLRIRKRIESADPLIKVAFLGQAVPYLKMPLLQETSYVPHECLTISCSLISGKIQCEIDVLNKVEGRPELAELERMLYDDFEPVEVLRKHFTKIKIQLMIERYKIAISSLQVKLVPETQMSHHFKILDSYPADRICLQFVKDEVFYIIVTFEPKIDLSIQLGFHLLSLLEDKIQIIDVSMIPIVFDSLKRIIKLEEVCQRGIEIKHEDGEPSNRAEYADIDIEAFVNKRMTSMEKQLAYAISMVDDRLGFLKIKQELAKRQIQMVIGHEDGVSNFGGVVGDIKDFTPLTDMKSKDFGKHVTRCAIRLDSRARGSWQMDISMSTPPLFRDKKNRDTDFVKPIPKVTGHIYKVDLKAAPVDIGVAGVVHDRLVSYGNVYELVKKFSKGYQAYYNRYCTVCAFTYHKFLLSYGKNRDMLLILTFGNAKQTSAGQEPAGYKLCFGTAHSPNESPNKSKLETCRVNPHAHPPMAIELNKQFNKNKDILDLVNHLVTTLEPMSLIYNFYRIRFVSVKPHCGAMGIEAPFPLILKGSITVLNRTTIRLGHGDIHLEIAMLMEEKVAIRDASRGTPKAAGLYELLVFLSNGENTYMVEAEETEESSFQQNSLLAPNPLSVGNSLQVPTPGRLDGNSPRGMLRSPGDGIASLTQLKATRRVIITTHEILQKVMSWNPVEEKPNIMQSYLDTHFNNLAFIKKISIVMDHFKNGNGVQQLINGMQIRDVQKDVDHVRVEFPTIGPDPATVQLHIFLDPLTFLLRVKITYSADEPSEDNLCQLEEYAQKRVLDSLNEYAVCVFIMFLRLTPFKTLDSLIPFLQIENIGPTRIVFPFCLKNLGSNNWKIGPGLLIHDPSKIEILVVFKSEVSPIPMKVYKVNYNSENNTVKVSDISSTNAAASPFDSIVDQINTKENAKDSAVFLLVNNMYSRFVAQGTMPY